MLSLPNLTQGCCHPREPAYTDLRLVPATNAAERALVAAIRVAVFVHEQRIPVTAEFDLDDFQALHVLAFCHEHPVGTGRIVISEDRARIGRFAVLPGYRRCRVGAALLRYCCDYCSARGIRSIILHAQIHAVPFYQRFGFAITSTVFDEEGIPHCRMERAL